MWQLLPFSRGNVTITVCSTFSGYSVHRPDVRPFQEYQSIYGAPSVCQLLFCPLGSHSADHGCAVSAGDIHDLSAEVRLAYQPDYHLQLLTTRFVSEFFISETEPGDTVVPNDVQNGTDAAWQSWITVPGAAGFHTVSHPIGTAAMMKYSLGGEQILCP